MCLCKYVVFTFSNTYAFGRLCVKLEKYGKFYPVGTIYHVTRKIKKRDRLAYEELIALAEIYLFQHFHFEGWEEFDQIVEVFKDSDVFGRVRIQMHGKGIE